MTPKEFEAALTLVVKKIGPSASVTTFIAGDWRDQALYCVVYPFGNAYKAGKSPEQFEVEADTFENILVGVPAKWAELSGHMHQQMVRKMALAIINLTAEFGSCTDAALRGADKDQFTDAEIKFYGADACAFADGMASNSPFKIVTLGGANGAPDQIPEGATVN